MPYAHARWVTGDVNLDALEREDSRCLEDRDGLPVALFKSDWALRWAEQNYKGAVFLKTAPAVRSPVK